MQTPSGLAHAQCRQFHGIRDFAQLVPERKKTRILQAFFPIAGARFVSRYHPRIIEWMAV
jgi:hypothetical protein